MSESIEFPAAHVRPLADEELADVEDIISVSQRASGYTPTSLRLMARKPSILRAFSGLFGAVMREEGEVPRAVKWLLAHSVSSAAGCRYCQAHTAANGTKAGIDPAKTAALLEFETSALFSDAERAVIAFGLSAGTTPNAVEPTHFDALRAHYSEDALVELTAVVSVFGWLNRWNDTLASDLETAPLAFAATHLSARGWNVGKHAAEEEA